MLLGVLGVWNSNAYIFAGTIFEQNGVADSMMYPKSNITYSHKFKFFVELMESPSWSLVPFSADLE